MGSMGLTNEWCLRYWLTNTTWLALSQESTLEFPQKCQAELTSSAWKCRLSAVWWEMFQTDFRNNRTYVSNSETLPCRSGCFGAECHPPSYGVAQVSFRTSFSSLPVWGHLWRVLVATFWMKLSHWSTGALGKMSRWFIVIVYVIVSSNRKTEIVIQGSNDWF